MVDPKTNELMEKIVSLCKRRGFIFQSSEIYGGINGFWDYGPLGAELKRNVKELWWRSMTRQREDIVGLEATIIMHPKIWEASGHTSTFSDPMVDCLLTGKRFRADQIEPLSGTIVNFVGAADLASFRQLEEGRAQPERSPAWSRPDCAPLLREVFETSSSCIDPKLGGAYCRLSGERQSQAFQNLVANGIFQSACIQPFSVLMAPGKDQKYAYRIAREFYQKRSVVDPVVIQKASEPVENTQRYNPENGSLLTEPRLFNLMFKTYVGPVESDENVAYLRPETAQAIFAQFKNVLEVSRQKVPFGICQIGKAFRNEINPRNYTFRSREFEQMELEFFIRPDEVVEAIAGSVAGPSVAQPSTINLSQIGAGKPGTNTGSSSASVGTNTSACRAQRSSSTGKSRMNSRITRGRRWTFCSSSHSANGMTKAS